MSKFMRMKRILHNSEMDVVHCTRKTLHISCICRCHNSHFLSTKPNKKKHHKRMIAIERRRNEARKQRWLVCWSSNEGNCICSTTLKFIAYLYLSPRKQRITHNFFLSVLFVVVFFPVNIYCETSQFIISSYFFLSHRSVCLCFGIWACSGEVHFHVYFRLRSHT